MWTYSAYAAIGSSHERHHSVCQDAVAVAAQETILIGAIADGAGSTSYGGIGAQIAVQEFLDFVCKQHLEEVNAAPSEMCHMTAELFEKVHKSILEQIIRYAEKQKKPVEDFATTFMGVIATPSFAVVGHIGDGFAVMRSEEAYTLIAAEAMKEFVNQTSFITDPQSHLHIGIIPSPITFLAMGTDGLTDVCLEQKTLRPHAQFFKPFDDYLETQPSEAECQTELAAFLRSEKLNARTQDDKSLLIARWMHD